MTKLSKRLLSALLLIFIIAFSSLSVSAAEVKDSENALSITIPDDYVVLKKDNAKEKVDFIESLGYSVDSFKASLLPTKNNPTETLFLAVKQNKESQIALKTWATDFSKKVVDFSGLDDSSLFKTAEELISTEKTNKKIVLANGMKLVEVRSESKDSGGDFCSVQYLTVRSGRFYSLNFTFPGKIDAQKVQSAWDTLVTMHIGNNQEAASWDFDSILTMVILGVGILVSLIVAVLIIISVVKDIKKRRADINESADYILRRK